MGNRNYQTAAVEQIRDKLRTGKRRPLLVCPTGSGKTHILADIVAKCIENGNSVLCLMHRRQLVTQMVDRFNELGIDSGIIMAGYESNLSSKCQIATCQTYSRRLQLAEKDINKFFIDASVILIDEAHHAVSTTYQKIFSHYKEKIVIGVTATPYIGSGGLGTFFDSLVCPVSVKSLIDDGYLVPGIYYGPSKPDLARVKTVMGDWENKGLNEVMNQPKIIGNVVDNWMAIAGGKKTMVFAVRVSHSKALRDEFLKRGVSAEHLDAHSDDEARDATLSRFRSGETQVLTNVALYTEGTDIPELECIVVARPTKSIGLHLQILGRGARPYPGKENFTVIDHGGNVERLGFYEDEILWELSERECRYTKSVPRKKEKTLLTCEYCSTVFEGKRCPRCGNEIKDYGKKIAAMEADLVPLKKHSGPTAAEKLRFQRMLEWHRLEKGFKPGWVYHQYQTKFKEKPNQYQVEPLEPDDTFSRYLHHLRIKWAKSKRRVGCSI